MKVYVFLFLLIFSLVSTSHFVSASSTYANLESVFVKFNVVPEQVNSIDDLLVLFGDYSTSTGSLPSVENMGDYFRATASCNHGVILIASNKFVNMNYLKIHAKFRVISSKTYALTFGVTSNEGTVYYGVANLPYYETAYGFYKDCPRNICYRSTEGVVVSSPQQGVVYDVTLLKVLNTAKLYVNGVLVSQTQVPVLNSLGNPFLIIKGVSCAYSSSIVIVYDFFDYSVEFYSPGILDNHVRVLGVEAK